MQLELGVAARSTTGPGAPCAWCGEPIPTRSSTGRRVRADAETCSRACRQGRHRFGRDMPSPAAAGATRPMRFAYADPPYPGMAERCYGEHPDYAGEVDHEQLLEQLVREFPDGWALSTSSSTLRLVLALVPDDVQVRIGAWTKPMPPRRARRARRAWEPVLFCGGRPAIAYDLVDHVHAAPLRAFPGQIVGTKPPAFCWWVFRGLGAAPGDELVDLFPGSGAVGRAWDRYASDRAAERVA